MKKIYIIPATDVYNVNHRNVIMTSPGAVGDEVSDPSGHGDLSTDISTDPQEGGSLIDDQLGRSSNGGNVWDNAW